MVVSKEALQYIKDKLEQGYDKKQLRAHMLENGYGQETLDNAFALIDSSKWRKHAVAFLLVLFLAAAGAYAYLYYIPKQPTTGFAVEVNEIPDLNEDPRYLILNQPSDITGQVVRDIATDNVVRGLGFFILIIGILALIIFVEYARYE